MGGGTKKKRKKDEVVQKDDKISVCTSGSSESGAESECKENVETDKFKPFFDDKYRRLYNESAEKEVPYNTTYNKNDMMDLVMVICVVLVVLTAVFAVCCYCMSRSDKKLQKYVLALAKRRGRKIDKKQLKRLPPPSQGAMAESCPVLLADAGIIIP